jgi:EAL domain-containing protein (putative c-di-GMP-specific phosphodiesterase class I)
MRKDPEGETLIRTLVQLGKSMAIETLAEGIEQAHELSLLQGESCDTGQGFLLARPLSVEDCATFLSKWAGSRSPVGDGAPRLTA